MTSTTQTIKFNVGGTHNEVSKSLLENFKDSMLERSASKVWNEGGDEVFIEGNGHRFQYVLDFMRHGKVTLPSSETINAFFTEMKYYGMNCNLEKVKNSGDESFPKLVSKVTKVLDSLATDKYAAMLTHNIMSQYCSDINAQGFHRGEFHIRYCKNLTHFNDVLDDENQFLYKYLHNDLSDFQDITTKVNALIIDFGLEITGITRNSKKKEVYLVIVPIDH